MDTTPPAVVGQFSEGPVLETKLETEHETEEEAEQEIVVNLCDDEPEEEFIQLRLADLDLGADPAA